MPNVYSKQRFLLATFPALPRSSHTYQDLENQNPDSDEKQSFELGSAMEQCRDPCPSNGAANWVSEEGFSRSREAMKALLKSVARANEKGTCYGTPLSQRSAAGLNDATDALKSYLLIFQFHGFDFSVADHDKMLKQCTKMLRDVVAIFSHGFTWLDYFKYKNSAFFAAWNKDQTLPPRPDWLQYCSLTNPRYLLGGAFYRWQHRMFKYDELRKGFSLDVLQSKGGMPRPDEVMIKAAEDKAVKTMTTPKEQGVFEIEVPFFRIAGYLAMEARGQGVTVIQSFDWNQKVIFHKEYMVRQCKRTTRDVMKGFDLPLDVLTNFILPSPSANYNNSRSHLGAWGDVQKLVNRNKKDGGEWSLRDNLPTFSSVMVELQDSVGEAYGPEGVLQQEVDRMLDVTRSAIGCKVNFDRFLKAWRIFFWKCVHFAMEHEQEAFCQVVGLAESLKIRTISKGPPVTYFVLKPLQHAMWSHLQRYWNFELTGTPITEELMNKRFRRFIGGGFRFHSGDYSAATDELHSWVSECIANEIVDIWDENSGFDHTPFRWLFLNSLTGHTYEHEGEKLPQRRGQLMGSITSFPILCLANISLMRAAYEVSHGVTVKNIRELPIWVNGDDCLTAYHSLDFPVYWRGFGGVMGFRESVGKTYDSEEFCSINSTTFDIEDDHWRLRKYVNLRLINGHVRSAAGGSKNSTKKAHELGSVHRKLISMTPDELVLPVHREFMRKNREVLETYPGPWFLPEYLCGLGLVNVEGVEYSRQQLLTVSALRVMYGQGVECPPVPTQADWHLYDVFHKYCRKAVPLLDSYPFESYVERLPVKQVPGSAMNPYGSTDSSYGDAFKAVILAEFVTNKTKNLFDRDVKAEYKRCYQYRLKVYRLAGDLLKELPHLKPAAPESIDYEKKVSVIPILGSAERRTLRVCADLGLERSIIDGTFGCATGVEDWHPPLK